MNVFVYVFRDVDNTFYIHICEKIEFGTNT